MVSKKQTYIVAGHHSWCRDAFTELKKLPGEWIFCSEKNELTEVLVREHSPRYVFFLHWSYKVPSVILEATECLCFHMTDLPYGRGGSPLQNLIVRGHRDTKITCLRMTEQFDAGPVYMKRPLTLEGSAQDIFDRSRKIIVDMIPDILKGDIKPVPQSGEPVIFRRRAPAESEIPQALSSPGELYDFIRMLDADGYPRAFIKHGNFVIEFRQAKMENGSLSAVVEIHSTAKESK